LSGASTGTLLGLAAGGAALGFVAWPGTPWGGALSVLLPFACGLQPSRHRAMSVAFGYYLGALAVFVASGFHVRDGIDPWASLAETLLVAGFAAIAWGMTAGEQKSDPLRFLTLMCAWFLTLATPLGAWGYAHPAMGWIFFGKGGMGIPTLLIAGLLTSFLITGIWWERRHGFALTATSARTRPLHGSHPGRNLRPDSDCRTCGARCGLEHKVGVGSRRPCSFVRSAHSPPGRGAARPRIGQPRTRPHSTAGHR
jgi:hypothetical protein